MPHAALWVVQRLSACSKLRCLLFQCRTRLCGWCSIEDRIQELRRTIVSMPHAALWVVQLERGRLIDFIKTRFNAARGFVGGAAQYSVGSDLRLGVSMPHAALWVVQRTVL